MRRRKFVKLASLSSLGIGCLAYFTGLGRVVNIFPSACRYDHDTMEKLAFIETIYPFFSQEKLFEEADMILLEEEKWDIIKNTFFKYFYNNSKKKFFTYNIFDREKFIVQYIEEATVSDEKSLRRFTWVRKNIMRDLLEKSAFPYSAYGYPEKKPIPFMADPSWDEYHKKPGSEKGSWFDI
jgi:hypothetical protein